MKKEHLQLCVEKQGTIIKMMPFIRNNGIAFIQSQGFISEYGIALACLANGDRQARRDYLGEYPYIYTGNMGNLTDCDSSGIVIGMKVKGATRLGIDLDTIYQINHVHAGLEDELDIDLPIELEDLEESNEANTHWRGLVGIVNRIGKLYESLSALERDFYYTYLRSRPTILGGDIRFIDYLKEHRIELNSVLAIVKPEEFWNWLRWNLLKIWPSRNYLRGGLTLSSYSMRTPTMNRFNDFCREHIISIAQTRLDEERGTFQLLGLAADLSGANIQDLYGFNGRCQITIAEDELDDIEDDAIESFSGIISRLLIRE